MINSVPVEVGIGLALIFFVVATVAAGVNQVISRWTDARAKSLWKSLEALLTPAAAGTAAAAPAAALPAGADLGARTAFKMGLGVPAADARPNGTMASAAAELLATPSVRALDPVTDPTKPTKIDHIPSHVFASALLELATIKAGAATTDTIEQRLTKLAGAYTNTPLGTYLTSIAHSVGNDLDTYLDSAGTWFDGQMSQLSAIYRKNTKWILLIIGLLAAVVFNVDTIQIGNSLRNDSNLRAGVITIADQVGADGIDTNCTIPAGAANRDLDCAREQLSSLNSLKLPIVGTWTWTTWKSSWGWHQLFWHLVGILLTAGAVALGAPFWYDTLKRLTGLRRSS